MSHDLNPSTAVAPAPSPVPNPAPTRRLGSIDAFRGLVMFLMMAEVLRFCTVASAVPGNTIWEFLCHHQSHVEWIGCVLHDTTDWPHLMSGFPAHWNKNSNPAWAFDVWFLNLFPRSEPFRDNGGGYATLSFIPTLATMILV